ncbi:hypothetical protein HDU85_007466 [Gaertneriomyces sp. JEL0708]|nr:hypothetical protein HDU85_007466 [Gaertneriomyces sp. JEL0708]
MESLLRLSTLRDDLPGKVAEKLQVEGRHAVITLLQELFSSGPPMSAPAHWLELLTTPTENEEKPLELADCQDIRVRVAVQIVQVLHLTMDDLEATLPKTALPIVLLGLKNFAVEHGGDAQHNPFAMTSRYVVRMVAEEAPDDATIIEKSQHHANLLEDVLQDMTSSGTPSDPYAREFICRLSFELGHYYFYCDNHTKAVAHLTCSQSMLHELQAANFERVNTFPASKLRALLKGCYSVLGTRTRGDPELHCLELLHHCVDPDSSNALHRLVTLVLEDLKEKSISNEVKRVVAEELRCRGDRITALLVTVCNALAEGSDIDTVMAAIPVEYITHLADSEHQYFFNELNQVLNNVVDDHPSRKEMCNALPNRIRAVKQLGGGEKEAISKKEAFHLPSLHEFAPRILQDIESGEMNRIRLSCGAIPAVLLLSILVDRIQQSYSQRDYEKAEKLFYVYIQIRSDDPSTASLPLDVRLPSLAQAINIGKLLLPCESSKSTANPSMVTKLLEQFFASVTTQGFFPETDLFIRILVVLLNAASPDLADLLQRLAQHFFDSMQHQSLVETTDVVRLYYLSLLGANAVRISTLLKTIAVEDDTELMKQLVQAPGGITVMQSTAYGMAAILGKDPKTCADAPEHFVKVLQTQPQLFRAISGMIGGIANNLRHNSARNDPLDFGPFSFITSTHTPTSSNAGAIPRQPVAPEFSATVQPQMTPHLLQFVQLSYREQWKANPTQPTALYYCGEAELGLKAFRDALRSYVAYISDVSAHFLDSHSLDHVWTSPKMQHLLRAAELGGESLACVVFSQMQPLDLTYLFGVLEVALAEPDSVTRLFTQAGDEAECYLWDSNLLEYAIAYFSRKSDSTTTQRLIRVMGRQELAPLANPVTRMSFTHRLVKEFARRLQVKLNMAAGPS